jgi:putative transposase
MPNHFHGIIGFSDQPYWRDKGTKTNLGNIVKAFKSKCVIDSKRAGLLSENNLWQKSFYDHVLRNEQDLLRIQEYILFNPLNWHLDSLNPKNS